MSRPKGEPSQERNEAAAKLQAWKELLKGEYESGGVEAMEDMLNTATGSDVQPGLIAYAKEIDPTFSYEAPSLDFSEPPLQEPAEPEPTTAYRKPKAARRAKPPAAPVESRVVPDEPASVAPPTPRPTAKPRHGSTERDLREARALEVWKKYNDQNYLEVSLPMLDAIDWKPVKEKPGDEDARLAHVEEQIETVLGDGPIWVDIDLNDATIPRERIDLAKVLPPTALKRLFADMPRNSPNFRKAENRRAWQEWGYGQLKSKIIDYLSNRELRELKERAKPAPTFVEPDLSSVVAPIDTAPTPPPTGPEPVEPKEKEPLPSIAVRIARAIEAEPEFKQLLEIEQADGAKVAEFIAWIYEVDLRALSQDVKETIIYAREKMSIAIDPTTGDCTIGDKKGFRPYLKEALKK